MADPVSLRDLRTRLGVSQQQLADQMRTTQPGVLKMERSQDPQVSSLRRYVDALAKAAGVDLALRFEVTIDGEFLELALPESEDLEMETDITTARTDWRLRAWDDARLEQRWLDESVIAISDDELGDLTDWPGDDEVRRRLAQEFDRRGDSRSAQAYGTFVRYWRYFRFDMQPGDRVAVPLVGRRVGVAEIVGEYEYRSTELDPRMRHVRRVQWRPVLERSSLSEPIRRVVNAPGTLCQIRQGSLPI